MAMHATYLHSIFKIWVAKSAFADVPDAKEQCEIDTSATCEINGVEYLNKGPCPSHAKTVHAAKQVDCSAPQLQVATTQYPHAYSQPTRINDSPSWLPFITLLIAFAILAALGLRSRKKSSGMSKTKIAIRWATIAALSAGAGILGARMVFYQTFDHILNKEGYFAVFVAMAAGLFGFAVIGGCVGILAGKHWKL